MMAHIAPRDTTILIVDDDDDFAAAAGNVLREGGYRIDTVASGQGALVRVLRSQPDLVLLDIGLPDIEGVEVCGMLQRHVPEVPIVFLTGRHTPQSVAAGLDLGADDYIVKPCDAAVLLARVRAVLRRASAAAPRRPEHITIREVAVDSARHEVYVRGEHVDLSPKTFNLLWLLVTNAGRVLSRTQIIDSVWGSDFYGDVKALDVYIRTLRRKIEEDPDRPALIQTVWGVGYCFAAPEDHQDTA